MSVGRWACLAFFIKPFNPKHMKKFILLLSFLLASVIAFAAPRSLSQMKEAAKGALKTVPSSTRGGSAQLEVMKQGEQFTVLGYATGGFAVIAHDDRFDAVLGYSDTKFSIDNMPPAMQWWMDAADEAMRQRLDAGETDITSINPAELGYAPMVDELMLTKWDQGTPYNNRVLDELGTAYPTGCVATAMAQIMYHHKYPERGTGRTVFSFNGTNKFVNFGSTTYRWDEMLPVYEDDAYSDAQAEAVATLMYHCGVAVNMNYAMGGSGAYDHDAATVLEEHFKYSTKFYTRDIYTERDWMNIIYDEISNGLPMLYGGVTADFAGHAFVFDGYDENGLVHVNWGWSGSGNGFYNVAVLDSPQGCFSYQQDMVAIHDGTQPQIPYSSQWGILPEVSWRTSTGQTLTTTGSFTVTADAGTLDYTVTNLINCDAYAFTGQIALVAVPEGGGAPTVLDAESVKNVAYYGLIDEISSDYSGKADISALPDGVYRVYLASKATTETEWQPVRSNETVVNNYLLTISGGAATVAEGDPGWTTGIENAGASAPNGDGMVRVYTADGVLVYSAKADAFSLDDVPAHGILIVKRGAETVKVVK